MPDQFLHSTYTVHIGRRHVEMAANRVKESLPSLPPNNFLLVSQDSSVIQVWLARLANDQKAKTSAVRHNEQEGRYLYMWNSVVWPLRNIILVQKAIFLRGMPSEPPSCCKLRHALVTKCIMAMIFTRTQAMPRSHLFGCFLNTQHLCSILAPYAYKSVTSLMCAI